VVADIVDASAGSEQERLIGAAVAGEQVLAVRGAAVRGVEEPDRDLPELAGDRLPALGRLRRVRALHRELAHAVQAVADRYEHGLFLAEPRRGLLGVARILLDRRDALVKLQRLRGRGR